jgi:hypothetical protein
VRIVYSPLDALKIARDHPDKEVVFFALGFETTMPSTAVTVLQAEREGIRNFSLLCNHITIIATIKAILGSPELTLDGFLGPGHASMVIGTVPYGFIAEHYGSRSSSPGSSGSTFCSQSQWFYVSSPRNAASSRTNTGASRPRPATAPRWPRSAASSSCASSSSGEVSDRSIIPGFVSACPALFDLGEGAKVVMLSVTEGDDKPLKYPHMFRAADIVIITKSDLLPHVDFSIDRCLGNMRAVNRSIRSFVLSAITGEGVGAWHDWLKAGGSAAVQASV